MPTYEYECKTCGETFDVFQSIKAAPLRRTKCERCDEVRPVRRLIGTGGALIFKGSGFYQTDYRSDGYKKAADADKKSTSGDESSKKDSAKGDKKKKTASGQSSPKSDGKSSGGSKSG